MATVSHLQGVGPDGSQVCVQLTVAPKLARKELAAVASSAAPRRITTRSPLRPGAPSALLYDVSAVRAGGCNPSKYGTRVPTNRLSLGAAGLSPWHGLGARLLHNGLQVFRG
eukprot:TRINITY_DN71300_c0_g1_i1.p1 TRINITY_DN71300_c0_g1~~TRINITY_DN71300_c0_g1_i1.p1  ORF type:complete len:112 (+),score=25.12 TRINITY_DN71300_c0_g1_i1:73-408(+)